MALNVLTDLGANNLVADGTTDNTAHYNAAVALLTAPYTLYFPTGTYRFASTIAVPSGGVKFYGDGKYQTIIKGTRVASGGGAVLTAATSCELADLQLTTTDDANSCDQCLDVSGKTGVTLTRVLFSNGKSAGIRSATSAQVFCRGCEWTNIYQQFSASGVSGCLNNSLFVDCWFHDMNQPLSTNHAIYINAPDSSHIPTNVTITGCVFDAWTSSIPIALKGDDVDDINAQGMTVVGNVFNGNLSAEAIILNHTSATITGNCFYSCNGVFGFGSQSLVVSGNSHYIASDAGLTFAAFTNCNDITAVSNTVSTPIGTALFSTGFSFVDCLNVAVQANTFIGVMRPVCLQASGVGNTSRATVKNNKFGKPAAWTYTGPHYFYGNANTYYGVAVDGGCTKVQILDNECESVNYEVYFTISSGVGQMDSIRYRSASWDVPLTAVFGYQNAAVPTNFRQYTVAAAALVPGTSGTAFAAVAS